MQELEVENLEDCPEKLQGISRVGQVDIGESILLWNEMKNVAVV